MIVVRGVLWGTCVLLFAGCGGAAGAKVEALVPASGTIKLNGRPVERVRLTFHPADGNKAVGGCWAVTDSQGKYVVMHLSNKEGMPPGAYHVTFSRYVKPDGSPLGAEESPTLTTCSESVAPLWSDLSKAGLHNKTVVPDSGSSSLDFNIATAAQKK